MQTSVSKPRAAASLPRLLDATRASELFAHSKGHHANRVHWEHAWIANSSALIVLVIWMVMDPAWSGVAYDGVRFLPTSVQALWQNARSLPTLAESVALFLFGLAILSFLLWGALSFWGSRNDRSIRSWLAFTTNFALWIAMLTSWNDVAWIGKSMRAAKYIDAIESISSDLRSNWASCSGESETLGPYMAYPISNPTSLILMTCPTVPKGMQSFNGAERAPNGNIAFPLVGSESGDWLEWSPSGHAPGDFKTGLGQSLQLLRATKLNDHWFLVRYR